jgi:cytosine/adenosine deaminase-related metal-dependent hydrolase
MLDLGAIVNIGHGNIVAEYSRIAYVTGGHDIEIMGRHGCTVSHCPTNLIRRARALESWKAYTAAGINMALGTDTFPRDLVMQMRMASYMGKLMAKDLTSATAAEVFEAATLGGARSLGRSDLGRLQAGAKADIVIIDQTRVGSLRYGAIRDPIKSLVECGMADDVESVFVDGVLRMENRVIPGVDLNELQHRAQVAGEWIWENWENWDPQGRTAENMNPWSYPLQE